MLSRFYAISNLTDEGLPVAAWRAELEAVLSVVITVRLPEPLRNGAATLTVNESVARSAS